MISTRLGQIAPVSKEKTNIITVSAESGSPGAIGHDRAGGHAVTMKLVIFVRIRSAVIMDVNKFWVTGQTVPSGTDPLFGGSQAFHAWLPPSVPPGQDNSGISTAALEPQIVVSLCQASVGVSTVTP